MSRIHRENEVSNSAVPLQVPVLPVLAQDEEEAEALAEYLREDPLGAFRGMCFGVLCSLPLWALVVQAACLGKLR